MYAHNLSDEFLEASRKLFHQENLTTGDMRRAISTAYYAVFHKLCYEIACCFIGENKNDHPRRAWVEAYRALQHGSAFHKCKKIISNSKSKDKNMGVS